ncbi:MAG: glycosyltransferase [Gemmatimonadetes bacterium]|nr:glycosyltransferase [Gemmatimonadota bacterium]MBT5058164.1 glycosyltransferase [Gemmatimonadota bacterium]MBT5141553.1 glycosyltransferase [Gemmatimonadota bacterium]MBT5590856.1 glycosyltransferase [Gemmatimonadota bacterium]MBT5965080.1 glycosyltransferase [Gemmatimonadota bacterium]
MNVLFFWEPVGGLSLEHRCNPYAGLLDHALHAHDIHLELGDYGMSPAWLEAQRSTHDVLHLNWLHLFYRRDDLAATVAAFHDFAESIHVAHRLGYRIVWTLHNLYPHERPFPQIDHMARLLVADHADIVLAHCEHAAALARKHFYCRDVRVVPHGNFIDVFRNDLPQAEARARLDLDSDDFVYLFFGNARGYKSIETLIDAFVSLQADDAVLGLMMRNAFDPSYGQQLADHAGNSGGRIRIWTSEFFANDDFQLYLNSADVVVLPFAEVLTSGSAITALGFGRPVIAPALGCLPELIGDTAGIIYDPAIADALPRAMETIRRRDLTSLGAAARARAESLDWAGIATHIVAAYRGDEISMAP